MHGCVVFITVILKSLYLEDYSILLPVMSCVLNNWTALIRQAMVKYIKTFTRPSLKKNWSHVLAYLLCAEALTINVHNSREGLLHGENITSRTVALTA